MWKVDIIIFSRLVELMLRTFAISILVIISLSCEEPLDPDFDFKPLLNVAAVIAPDRSPAVSLTSSEALGNSPRFVLGAEVAIISDTERIGLEENAEAGIYRGPSLNLASGQEIILNASQADFPEINGSTVIPAQICASELSLRVKAQSTTPSGTRLDLDLEIGLEIAEDVHVVIIEHQRAYELSGMDTIYDTELSRAEIIFSQSVEFGENAISDLRRGILVKQEAFSPDGQINLEFTSTSLINSYRVEAYELELRSCSQDYFEARYRNALAWQRPIDNINREPIIEYSNIEGGVGYFGGYNYCIQELELIR